MIVDAGEYVVPATTAMPVESTAMPAGSNILVPRQVEYSRTDSAESSFVTKEPEPEAAVL